MSRGLEWRIVVSFLLAAALFTVVAALSRAELPPAPHRAVVRYLTELARVENSPTRLSTEPLFASADSLNDYLFGPDSTRSIEWLPEAELDSLQEELRGINLTVSDYVFTDLDSVFFRTLVDAKGLPQDVEFMKIYGARNFGKNWVGGCTRFGSDLLVDQHEAWRQFIARHPQGYARYAAEEDANVIEELVTSRCACGDSLSVGAELGSFLRRHPEDPATPQVKARLQELRKGESKIEFKCFGHSYH
jgi:hypothetical protein